MARIKIHDLPMSLKVSREEVRAMMGGSCKQHDVGSIAYLPNAFFSSRKQLLSSQYLSDIVGSGPGDGNAAPQRYILAPLEVPGSSPSTTHGRPDGRSGHHSP